MSVKEYVEKARKDGASDIHLVRGLTPRYRVDGAIREMEGAPLTSDDCLVAARELAGSEIRHGEAVGELDLALTIAGVRCRVNLFRQQEAWSAAIRLLNDHIPDLSELGLPKVVSEFPAYSQGLVLITGETGSGKSTIAKLIAGFWDVTGGAITLGGADLRQIPLEQLNRQIAYVSQDNYLFDRTVRDNIRMGKLDATDEEVEAAASAAGCDELIRALPQGYDTVCGGGGGHLSGGEKQRISIARAMLKDAPIVILDEATASMDPENEAMIQRAISRLTKGRTLVVIAHRLGTIAGADQIVVMEKGRIVDHGSQDTLLERCPLYRQMWDAYLGVQDKEA